MCNSDSPTWQKGTIILAVMVAVLSWTLIALWTGSKSSEEAHNKEAAKHFSAIEKLEAQLVLAENQIIYLQEKQQKTKDLVESTGVIINELQTSITTSGNTIKDLKNQQAKIKTAVIALIDDYNRIITQIDDATTEE